MQRPKAGQNIQHFYKCYNFIISIIITFPNFKRLNQKEDRAFQMSRNEIYQNLENFTLTKSIYKHDRFRRLLILLVQTSFFLLVETSLDNFFMSQTKDVLDIEWPFNPPTCPETNRIF